MQKVYEVIANLGPVWIAISAVALVSIAFSLRSIARSVEDAAVNIALQREDQKRAAQAQANMLRDNVW